MVETLSINQKVWVENISPKQYKESEKPYELAKIISIDDKKNEIEVKYDNNKNEKVKFERIMKFTNETNINVNDMGDIEEIVEIDLLNNLKNRFNQLTIHTNVGPTLIIMNPYKKIENLYGKEKIEHFIKMHYSYKVAEERTSIPEPHIYDLTLIAIMKLIDTQKNQAIIISGESGAGKTEAAKTSMSCITYYFGKRSKRESVSGHSLEDQILSCNPVLEAFGNAKTVRNDNSSRFGKYVMINLNIQTGEITGANIQTYLLEKSRVCEPSEGERNYHIFYQLLSSREPDLLDKLYLKNDPNIYKYLSESHCFKVDNIDDYELFQETKLAFQILGFSEEEKFTIYKVLAVCLLMGNLEFIQQGDHFIADPKDDLFNKICELLAVKKEQFERSLTYKTRMMGTTAIESPNNQVDCYNFRNSFAKEIYNRLFNFIVKKLNQKLDNNIKDEDTHRYIGLLDIFGFENFKNNSLEQMCINFTNEKLQQLYINDIFKGEEAFYIREGLKDDLHHIEFKDNQEIIDCMDKSKQGIFQLLDETCLTNSDDKAFLSKITKQCEKNSSFKIPKFSTGKFMIVHTAKEVEYNITGFVMKNVDETRASTIECISNSTDKIIRFIFLNATCEEEFKKNYNLLESPKKDNKSTRSASDKYLGAKFRSEMSKLMGELTLCECHYIRCIKPNELKKANLFISTFAFEQIRYLGILDTIRVRKEGYPSRIQHKNFFLNFFDICFWPNLLTYEEYKKLNEEEFKELCVKALDCIYPKRTKQQILIGITKVLMKSEFYIQLRKIKDKKLEDKKNKQLIISKFYFACKVRRRILTLIKKAKFLINWYKAQKFRMKMRMKRFKVVLLQSFTRMLFVKKKIKKMRKSVALIASFIKMRKIRNKIKKLKVKTLFLQRIIKRFLIKVRLAKRRKVKDLVYKLIDKTWEMIKFKMSGYYATIIQSRARVILTKKKFKVIIKKGQEKRKLFNQTKLANKVSRYIRGYMVRKILNKKRHFAMKIQGFFKMTKLSSIVIDMRRRCLIIQRNLHTRYLMRSAIENRLKEFYDNENFYLSKTSAETQKALFPNEKCENEKNQIESNDELGEEDIPFTNNSKKTYKDTILPDLSPFSDPKIVLFARVIEIDFLIDSSETYENEWAQEYNKIYVSNMKNNTPIQQIILGGFHTVVINNKGQIYTWGWNNYGQCAVPTYSTLSNVIIPKITRDEYGQIPVLPVGNSLQSGKQINTNNVSQIKGVSCGEEHTMIYDDSNNLFSCGKNTNGQLGLGHCWEISYPAVVPDFKSKITLVKSFKETNYAVTTNNEIYSWPYDKSTANFKPRKIPFDRKQTVVQISCGNNFTFFLSTHGTLYSFGNNKYGELGLGDNHNREKPEMMCCLFEAGERITQIYCGFKHSVANSANGKVFTWGLNNSGQLGSGTMNDLNSPKQVNFDHFLPHRFKIIQVAAGFRSTFFLNENRQLFYSGKYNNSDISHKFATKIDLKNKSPEIADENCYSIVKIFCTWNKSMSLFYAILADIQDLNKKKVNKHKIYSTLNTLSANWIQETYEPPYINSIAGFFSNSYMRKPKISSQKIKKRDSNLRDSLKNLLRI